MAIGKWMPFGTPQSSSTAQAQKPQEVAVISSANAKKFGLENFGNTCYANSVLQALYFCAPFREQVLQYADTSTPDLVLQTPHAPQPPPTQPSPVARWKPERKFSGVTPDATNGIAVAGPVIPSSPPTLFSALRSLFLYISQNPSDKGTVAPRAFIEKLKDVNELFRSTMHQDAHEFLNYLLNKIVEEMEEERKQLTTPNGDDCEDAVTFAFPPSRNLPSLSKVSNSLGTLPSIAPATTNSSSGTSQAVTLVHRLFEGVLTSETRCLTCETVSSRDEAFLDLSVDIEQNSSITACLRQFSASEMLCHKNKFFCDSCCDLQEAEKRMKIKKLPNILALHLKRFKYQEDVQKYIKLAYRVAFPLELRLFNTVDDIEDADRLFELFAIVVHIGNGPHHGHYISVIKTMGTWLAFDDDAVGAIDETDIPKYFGESNSGSAYVLYYQAVDLKTAALGLQSTVVEAADQVLATPQPQPQPQEQAGSSPQAAPAVPPGLAEEGDSSDLSDLPYPVTPSASSSPQSEVQPRHVNGENATVKVTLPDEVAVSSASSSTLSAAVKGGIFKSLRRAPSVKVPTSIGLLADQLQSRGLHRNHTTIGSRKSVENVPPVPDLSLALDGLNGKDQEKGQPVSVERKVTWFNRRSGRSEKSRASMELPPTQALKSEPENESSSAATWFKNTGAGPKPKGNLKTARRPSEPNIFAPGGGTGLGFSTPSTSTSTNTSIHVEIPKRRRYDRADDDSHSARSAASSAVSTLALLGPDIGSTSSSRSPRHRPSQRSLSPPTPTFSRGERASSHERTMEKERHRPPMPMNSIEGLRSSSVRAMSPSDSIRKRASSPRMRSPAPLDLEAPPVPPKPSSMKHTNGVVKGGQDHRPSRRATATATATEANEYWHKRDKPPQESVGIGAFPIGDRNSSTTGSASNGIKRATRKLSLTTPMLHFGKRDKKERESERERDKEKIPTSSIGGIPTAVRT